MFLLAFVAGWLQGHWWGFISRNYVVWPTFFLMNVFIALKGSHFWFYIGLFWLFFLFSPNFTFTFTIDTFCWILQWLVWWSWPPVQINRTVVFMMTKPLVDETPQRIWHVYHHWNYSIEDFEWHWWNYKTKCKLKRVGTNKFVTFFYFEPFDTRYSLFLQVFFDVLALFTF